MIRFSPYCLRVSSTSSVTPAKTSSASSKPKPRSRGVRSRSVGTIDHAHRLLQRQKLARQTTCIVELASRRSRAPTGRQCGSTLRPHMQPAGRQAHGRRRHPRNRRLACYSESAPRKPRAA